MTYFSGFFFLDGLWLRKIANFMIMGSSRDEFTLLLQNSVTISVGFQPPCWWPVRWTPTRHFHTKLFKFVWVISPNISRILKIALTWILTWILVYTCLISFPRFWWLFIGWFNFYLWHLVKEKIGNKYWS